MPLTPPTLFDKLRALGKWAFFLVVPVVPLVWYGLLQDREIPLRLKARHFLLRVAQVVCHMYMPASNFHRARFERITALSPEGATVAAEKETRVQCVDVPISEHVSVRVFRDPSQKPTATRPLTSLLYIHGGGFTIFHANNRSYHNLCRNYAQSGPFVVVSVEYRLAPEHRFPIPLADAQTALVWCATSSHPLLQDCGEPAQRRVCLAGDSAGGNMAAALCVLARDGLDVNLKPTEHKIHIAHALLIYPSLHMLDTPARRNMTDAYIIPSSIMDFFSDSYLGDYHEAAAHDIRVAPHTAASLRNLPPTTIITAAFDPLVDDGRQYATLLQESGVQCKLLEYRTIHGFFTMHDAAVARTAFADSLPFLLPE